MLSRQQRAEHRRGQPPIDQCAIQPGTRWGGLRNDDHRFTPLAPVSTASSTSIGKEVRVRRRRRVIRQLQIRRCPWSFERDAPLPDLCGLDRSNAGRHAAPGAICPKCASRPSAARRRCRHRRRSRGSRCWARRTRGSEPYRSSRVIVSQVAQPADGRMAVRVCLEGGGRDLGVEQLLGIVLAALQLRDDHGPLRLAFLAGRRGRWPCARLR